MISNTGLRLTKGQLFFDNNVVVKNNEEISYFNSISDPVAKSHGNEVYSVLWSPTGTLLAVIGDNGSNYLIVYEWDGSTLTEKDSKVFGNNGNAKSVSWNPNGRYLTIAGDSGTGTTGDEVIIYVWNGSSLTVTDSTDFGDYANSAIWSPNGEYLAVGGDNGTEDLIVYKANYTTELYLPTYATGLIFGDSSKSAEYDLDVFVLSGSYVDVQGTVFYDNLV